MAKDVTYNVNRKVANFGDFTANIGAEKEELKKVRRSTKPNSEDQQHIGNARYKFNKVTRKMDDLSPSEIDDSIESIEKLEEAKKEEKIEFLDEHPKYDELNKKIKELNALAKEISKNLVGGMEYVQEYITGEVN
jgi:vacuolar-type H+-ATPase subunit I/STV1